MPLPVPILDLDPAGLVAGDPVSAWADPASGLTALPIDGVPGSAPSCVVEDGRKFVRFDGLADGLVISGFAVPRPFTVFMVYRSRANTGRALSGDGNPNNWLLGSHSSGARWHFTGAPVCDVGGEINTWYVLSAVDDVAANAVYSDGVLLGTAGDFLGWGPALYLGTNPGSERGSVDIARVLVYGSALGTADRQAVEADLGGAGPRRYLLVGSGGAFAILS